MYGAISQDTQELYSVHDQGGEGAGGGRKVVQDGGRMDEGRDNQPRYTRTLLCPRSGGDGAGGGNPGGRGADESERGDAVSDGQPAPLPQRAAAPRRPIRVSGRQHARHRPRHALAQSHV